MGRLGSAGAGGLDGGLDLVWRISVWKYDQFRFRDLIASLTVTELAGTVYGSVAIGVGSWSRTDQPGTGDVPDFVLPPLGPYW